MSTDNKEQEAIVTNVGVREGVSITKTEKILSVKGKLGLSPRILPGFLQLCRLKTIMYA